MKKALSLLLALTMVLSLNVIAFAAGTAITEDGTGSGSVTISHEVEEAYTVTIPADFDLETGATISASGVFIESGKQLEVTVASASGWKLKRAAVSGDAGITYKLSVDGGDALANGAAVLTVAAGTATGSADLTATLTGTATEAGMYTDTLTFTVAVGDAPTT